MFRKNKKTNGLIPEVKQNTEPEEDSFKEDDFDDLDGDYKDETEEEIEQRIANTRAWLNHKKLISNIKIPIRDHMNRVTATLEFNDISIDYLKHALKEVKQIV